MSEAKKSKLFVGKHGKIEHKFFNFMEKTSLVIFSLFMSAIIIRSLSNLKKLLSNLAWLGKDHGNLKKLKPARENFTICIPMLREQRIVAETIQYFSELNYPKNRYKLILVTTSREIKERLKYPKLLNIPSTFTLATKTSNEINKKLGRKMVIVMNYPRTDGVMSHQINYAVRKMVKSKANMKSIFVVYNADSRPNPDTLSYVSNTIAKFERETGVTPNIVQQSSLFTLNYNRFPKTFSGYILKAASLFQTKWTLVHELARFRSQSQSVIKIHKSKFSIILNTKLSHCVGHGLFVRLKLLAKEYLPTGTINEDLPFGFYQCCKREPILPLAILENSENPETIKALLNQKKVWFYPYLEYEKCKNRVLRLGHYKSTLEVWLLTLQGQITGMIWFFQSFVFFIPFLMAIYLHSFLLLNFWLFGLILYWFLPTGIIYFNLEFLENRAGKLITATKFYDYLLSSFAGLFVILTHSIGPMLAVTDYHIKAKYFNKPVVKLKTER